MITIVSIFLAVLIVTSGAFLLLDNRMRRADLDSIKSRLLGTNSKKKSKSKQAAPTLMQTEDARQDRMLLALLKRLQMRNRLQALLEKAGFHWPVARLARLVLGGFVLGFVGVWYLAPPPLNRLAFATAPLFGALPIFYVIRKGRQRLSKFEEQFPEGLEFVARAMRAGHAFSVSLEMLHREFDEPLASEFPVHSTNRTWGCRSRWPWRNSRGACRCSTFSFSCRPCCCRSAPAATWRKSSTSWPISSARGSSSAAAYAPSAPTDV